MHEVMQRKRQFQQIDDPFIIKLHYTFETSSKMYYIFDLMNGVKLDIYLKQEFQLEEDKIKFFAEELVLGLKAFHDQGIVYGGMKPSNVVIDE
jgi:serine/threonine protein kinase